MINYTERLALLMEDIVARVPTLSFIDMSRVLVFARAGRTEAEGAYATCHCISLPPSEPGYYFWRDRSTGRLTRRSEWFVTKSPSVRIGTTDIDYMVSFTLPRYCDQRLSRSRKQAHYQGAPDWIAKLDTIVHELYHVDPEGSGLRRFERPNGASPATLHGASFLEDVAAMVRHYLVSGVDPDVYDFLRYGFQELSERSGPVTATTFRTFPSFPQRYLETLDAQPPAPACECIQPIRQPQLQTIYTERDLETRLFLPPPSTKTGRAGGARPRPGATNRTVTLRSQRAGAAAEALTEA